MQNPRIIESFVFQCNGCHSFPILTTLTWQFAVANFLPLSVPWQFKRKRGTCYFLTMLCYSDFGNMCLTSTWNVPEKSREGKRWQQSSVNFQILKLEKSNTPFFDKIHWLGDSGILYCWSFKAPTNVFGRTSPLRMCWLYHLRFPQRCQTQLNYCWTESLILGKLFLFFQLWLLNPKALF